MMSEEKLGSKKVFIKEIHSENEFLTPEEGAPDDFVSEKISKNIVTKPSDFELLSKENIVNEDDEISTMDEEREVQETTAIEKDIDHDEIIEEYEPQIANNEEYQNRDCKVYNEENINDDKESNSFSMSSEPKVQVEEFITSKPPKDVLDVFSDDEIDVDNASDSSSDSQSETDSSSDENSDSESELESNSDSEEEENLRVDNNEEDEEEDVISGPIVSKNEVIDEAAPTLPTEYKIPENASLELIGEVSGLVERSVIIRANISGEFRVLKENSIFCFEDRTILGPLFETFGRLQSPIYRVKFNTEEEFSKFKDRKGSKVYYVVSDSQFVYTDTIKSLKGTDASNCNDEELPEDEQEFSDDERELASKQAKKKKKKAKITKDTNNKTTSDEKAKSRKRNHSSNQNGGEQNHEAKKFQPYGYAQVTERFSSQKSHPSFTESTLQNGTTAKPQGVHNQMLQFQQQVHGTQASPYGVPFNAHQQAMAVTNNLQFQPNPYGTPYNQVNASMNTTGPIVPNNSYGYQSQVYQQQNNLIQHYPQQDYQGQNYQQQSNPQQNHLQHNYQQQNYQQQYYPPQNYQQQNYMSQDYPHNTNQWSSQSQSHNPAQQIDNSQTQSYSPPKNSQIQLHQSQLQQLQQLVVNHLQNQQQNNNSDKDNN